MIRLIGLYPHCTCGGKSVMQMVKELSEVHDAIEKYKDGKVYFLARAAGLDLAGNLLAHSLGRDALKSWNWTRNFRNNYAGVKASARDHDKGKRKVIRSPLKKGDAWYEIRKEFLTEKLATEAAKSKAKQLNRAEKQIEFTCKCGDPDILEQVVMTFPNVSPEVSGSWIVKQAVHDNDADAEAYNTSGTAEMKG
jgi:phage protein D